MNTLTLIIVCGVRLVPTPIPPLSRKWERRIFTWTECPVSRKIPFSARNSWKNLDRKLSATKPVHPVKALMPTVSPFNKK